MRWAICREHPTAFSDAGFGLATLDAQRRRARTESAALNAAPPKADHDTKKNQRDRRAFTASDKTCKTPSLSFHPMQASVML